MNEHDADDGGFFHFGNSARVSDDDRRKIEADTLEVNKATDQLNKGCGVEEKLGTKYNSERSRSQDEMKSHLQATREEVDRLRMYEEVRRGLDNTLDAELSANDFGGPSSMEATDDSEGRNAPAPSTDPRSSIEMRTFSAVAMKKTKTLRLKLSDVEQQVMSQSEQIELLVVEIKDSEHNLESQNLESKLASAKASTASLCQILEEAKRRQVALRVNLDELERRMRDVDSELTTLNDRLAQKQKEAHALHYGRQNQHSMQSEELKRSKTSLSQVRCFLADVQRRMDGVRQRHEQLSTLILQKEEKAKAREEIREQRNQRYSDRKVAEDKMIAAKSRLDRSRRSMAESGKHADLIAKRKQENDDRENGAVAAANSETIVLGTEKRAASEILARAPRPIEKASHGAANSRLAQLRSKRDNLRKDFEKRRARLQEGSSAAGAEPQSSGDFGSIKKIAVRTAEILKEEQKRLDRLKARRAKRSEALRKLEVVQFGSAVALNSERQVERDLAVQ